MLNSAHGDYHYQTAEIHHETSYGYFEKFKGREDGEEYKLVTEQITRYYLDHLNEKFQGIEAHIRYTRLITPLDVEKFTHHFRGSVFGLDILKAENPELSPRSGLKNLFYTGEDLFSHGLTPLNGVITASVISKKNLIKRFKKEAEKLR